MTIIYKLCFMEASVVQNYFSLMITYNLTSHVFDILLWQYNFFGKPILNSQTRKRYIHVFKHELELILQTWRPSARQPEDDLPFKDHIQTGFKDNASPICSEESRTFSYQHCDDKDHYCHRL